MFDGFVPASDESLSDLRRCGCALFEEYTRQSAFLGAKRTGPGRGFRRAAYCLGIGPDARALWITSSRNRSRMAGLPAPTLLSNRLVNEGVARAPRYHAVMPRASLLQEMFMSDLLDSLRSWTVLRLLPPDSPAAQEAAEWVADIEREIHRRTSEAPVVVPGRPLA